MLNSALIRPWLALSLEAFTGVALLLLFGFLPLSISSLLGMALLLAVLCLVGSWLYIGGGRSFTLHVLLYPFIAAIGIFSYVIFASWVVAILSAGLFFWRIQHNFSGRLYDYDYYRRTIIAILLSLLNLVYQSMIVSLLSPEKPDVVPLFVMLAVVLFWSTLVGWGEYMTREQPPQTPAVDKSLLTTLCSQLLQANLTLTVLYTGIASLLLALLYGLWSIIKLPLAGLFAWMAPTLSEWIERLIEKLSGLFANLSSLQNLFSHDDGVQEDTGSPLTETAATDLFSLLLPYLFTALVLVFAIWLFRTIWRRRYRQTEQALSPDTSPGEATISPIESESPGENRPGHRLRSLLHDWRTSRDDQARYLYAQFLRYMAKHNHVIRTGETSHEFLQRIRLVWTDRSRIELAEQITRFYEQHRYNTKPLSPEEVARMRSFLDQLRKPYK